MNQRDNNVLLAEFIGMEVCNFNIRVKSNLFGLGSETLHQMRFHESWDWLMPVVRYIKDIHNESLDMHLFNHIREIDSAIAKVKIKQAYKEVVRAVNYIRKQEIACHK